MTVLVAAGFVLDVYEGYAPLTVTATSSNIPTEGMTEPDTIAMSLKGHLDYQDGLDPLQFATLGRYIYGSSVTWWWDFGDGSAINTTDKLPSHTYLYPGVYSLKLFVTEDGDLNEYEAIVTVLQDPLTYRTELFNIATDAQRVAYCLGNNVEQGLGWSNQSGLGLVYPETGASIMRYVEENGEFLNMAYDSFTGLPFVINTKSNHGIDKVTFQDKVDELSSKSYEIPTDVKFMAISASHESYQIRPSDLFAYISPEDWANLADTVNYTNGLRNGFIADIELFLDKVQTYRSKITNIPSNRELYFITGDAKVANIIEYKISTNYSDYVLRKLVGNLLVYDKARYIDQRNVDSENYQLELMSNLIYWRNFPNPFINKIFGKGLKNSGGDSESTVFQNLEGLGIEITDDTALEHIYNPYPAQAKADTLYVSVWTDFDESPSEVGNSIVWQKIATITKTGYDTIYLWASSGVNLVWDAFGSDEYFQLKRDQFSGRNRKYYDFRMYSTNSFSSGLWAYYIDDVENNNAKGIVPYE